MRADNTPVSWASVTLPILQAGGKDQGPEEGLAQGLLARGRQRQALDRGSSDPAGGGAACSGATLIEGCM